MLFTYNIVKVFFNGIPKVGYFLFDSETKGSPCTGFLGTVDGNTWERTNFGKVSYADEASLIAAGKAEIAKVGGINNIPLLVPKAK